MWLKVVAKVKSEEGKANKLTYLVEGTGVHGEAEVKVYEDLKGHTDVDVVSVKRTKVMEIVNKMDETSSLQRTYLATVQATYVLDNGKESKRKYPVLLWAEDMDDANSIIKDYMRQGLDDMDLVKLAESDVDVVL